MLVDQKRTSSDVLARRRRQARAWLAVTLALHVSTLALTVALLPLGPIEQIDSLVIIIALAAGPPAGVLWLQWRRPSGHKPHQWPWRALAVAAPQAMALGFAGNAALDEDALAPPQRILAVLVVALLPAVTAELARRSLLRPLVAELGAADFELLVEPRTGQRSWFYSDSVALTDREVLISVRSGSGRATWKPKTERIALADVCAVGARAVVPQDSPWITLSDGRGLSVTPGDVVVIQCRDTASVLPIDDAAVFAELVRARATRVRGTPVGTLPVEAAAPPAERGHVAEVLPAPEPSGPVAHPVTGPVAPPRTGPGMALRWGLGFPLALLGIVGVPVGLLLSGGLLPPETDLERYRLVFCGLWIALSTAIWLRSWQRPRYWPVWALTSGFATAIIVAVQGLGLAALLGPIVGVLLTWAGRWVLIRPVGTDLAGSRVEIPLRLRGGETLLVQHDRMIVKVRGGAGGAVPQALALGELAFAQLGQFTCNEARFWPFPGVRLRLWRGPVLRLVSGRQQWLMPVDSPREVAAIVRGRAATAPRRDLPAALTLAQWHTLQSWAARQLTTSRRGPGLRQRTVGFRLLVAFPAALLGTSLFSESIGRGAELGSGAVVAGVALAIAAALVADWVRVCRRLRVAQDNALPPGSPDWGDLRPDHAPLEGWQPWWEESDQVSRVGSSEVGSR
ncbi:MAG TPA: hypothetical protein VF734_17580 [Pseudonocardiaceae bacterium]